MLYNEVVFVKVEGDWNKKEYMYFLVIFVFKCGCIKKEFVYI